MNLDTAPSADEGRDTECNVCGAENSYVMYDGDKVCTECQHVPDSRNRHSGSGDVWQQWFEHRRENYSGFTGPERVKMVGGFIKNYPKYDS